MAAVGFTVLVAHDAFRALEKAQTFAPELVCLDIGLPVMDGYELARRLRHDARGPIWIAAITGYGQDQDRARALDAGFDLHLVKPVDLDDLPQAFPAPKPAASASK